MRAIPVNLGPRSYVVQLGAGLLKEVGAAARAASPSGHQALLLADFNTSAYAERVADALVLEEFAAVTIKLPPGEREKSLQRASQLYDEFAQRQADRQTLVVAVGGGVLGDLAGFVAATFNRGLPWLVVPTTLLAMIDSSVGGKVGLNHSAGKNLIGAFHQPCAVVADLETLATLPDRECRSGLAEAVKCALALDADLFAALEREAAALVQKDLAALEPIIARCVELKAKIVSEDERETTGQRAKLNFGHTFGHAFEAVSGYASWLHGEAVAAGMVCACRLAERVRGFPRDLTQRLIALLKRLQLPVLPNPNWPAAEILHAMKSDKKVKGGRLRFILPTALGRAELTENVGEADVLATLQDVGGR